MSRTSEMRLIELMVMKQDITRVVEYLGKCSEFQFQTRKRDLASSSEKKTSELSVAGQYFQKLDELRAFFNIKKPEEKILTCSLLTDEEKDDCGKLIEKAASLHEKVKEADKNLAKVEEAYKEAKSFSNLQVPYSELDNLSFISLKIGKISPDNIEPLRLAVGEKAVIVPLGEDSTKILAASSKKSRFALDTELDRFGFVQMEIPKDFTGVPSDVLEGLEKKKNEAEHTSREMNEECQNFKETHEEKIISYLESLSLECQIERVEEGLESTSLVYHMTGWIPKNVTPQVMRDLDQLTEGRVAIREFHPMEVPAVINGSEQIPVKLEHGKFVKAFERMVFSYGSPLYGTVDPTPFVAVFFTLLFGIMFGDCGQGLVFLLAGILMQKNVIKVGGWNKFAPIFMAIGITSSIMGLITGEFFANESLLEPFALWVTGLFGQPRSPIVHMMPSSDPSSIKVIFGIFGLTIAVGFVINSIGLVLNMINNIIRKKYGKAFFGKTGLSGALFFWYVVVFAIRLAFFHQSPQLFDWIIMGVTLFFSAFGEPFERLFDGERPVLENGFGSMLIGGLVELIEVVSTYLSSSISFVRVGAFALAHAVLGFIIHLMAEKSGLVGGILVMIVGNAIVVVLEGMIVAIQVIRLQYYEFFSKFFNETGTEFKPFSFVYGK